MLVIYSTRRIHICVTKRILWNIFGKLDARSPVFRNQFLPLFGWLELEFQ